MELFKGMRGLCLLAALSFLSMAAHSAPKSKMIDFWNDYEPSSHLKINHSVWNSVLQKYVVTDHPTSVNRFRYDDVTDQDEQAIKDYVEYLQTWDPRQLNLDSKKAYWINLYNASVVSIVLRVEPENSVRSVSRIWKRKRFKIARQKMSLADIEHGVIRPLSNDPRVNFGFFHGTVGAGNILPVAFTGDNLDALLEENVRSFITQSSRGVDIQGNTLQVSSMFDWYKSDFGGSDDGVKNFIKQYVSSEIASAIDQTTSIAYQYDWELNKP